MRNGVLSGVCRSCKQPNVLHSSDRECPKSNLPDTVWRPLADAWYGMVLPAREIYWRMLEGEKQTRNRYRKGRCTHEDYRNAAMITAAAIGRYQEAIRIADSQLAPLCELVWGEAESDPTFELYGVRCGEEGFTNFSHEPMAFYRAAEKIGLEEQDLAAIAEYCGLFAAAGVG